MPKIFEAGERLLDQEGLVAQAQPHCGRLRHRLARHFGMKAHIAVDAQSGLVQTVTTTAANEADMEQVADLLHGKEEQVWADSGYQLRIKETNHGVYG